MFLASYAPGYGSLADPPGSSVLGAAVSWIEGTLLGTVATTAAVIAVAAVGFMMLSGRVDVRSGVTVILGCFILFGASTIAAGIRSSASAPAAITYSYVPPPPAAPAPEAKAPAAGSRLAADPHAGAALPEQ